MLDNKEVSREYGNEIMGSSQPIKQALHFSRIAAETDFPIVIEGETGVGKTFIGKLIHSLSGRRNFAILQQNCNNLSESLFESELFGHEEGAFTGATRRKLGKMELTNKGTLILDEISDMSLYNQAKLLNYLETRGFYRVGGTSQISSDVRIIVTSNRRLLEEIAKGKFREDLYYRLNVLCITIPPLRDRREDIEHFTKDIMFKLNQAGRGDKRLSNRAYKQLIAYDYPGNIRELENILKRNYVLCKSNEIEEIVMPARVRRELPGNDGVTERYEDMCSHGKSFWEVIHKPFLARDLNREEAKEIIYYGLKKTSGSYKKLMDIFNIPYTPRNYKRFMRVLRTHRLTVDTDNKKAMKAFHLAPSG